MLFVKIFGVLVISFVIFMILRNEGKGKVNWQHMAYGVISTILVISIGSLPAVKHFLVGSSLINPGLLLYVVLPTILYMVFKFSPGLLEGRKYFIYSFALIMISMLFTGCAASPTQSTKQQQQQQQQLDLGGKSNPQRGQGPGIVH